MTDNRNAFGYLVRRLDEIYEIRGIRIKLFEWEDYDAAYNDLRMFTRGQSSVSIITFAIKD